VVRPCSGRAEPGTPVHAPPDPVSPSGDALLSSAGAHQVMSAAKPRAQLLLEAGRDGVATAGQRPDHHPLAWVQIVDHGPGDMAQPTCDAVSLHRRADRLTDDKSDAWPLVIGLVTADMDDDVGLYRPHPSPDRGAELGRPGHAVLRWEHVPPIQELDQAVSEPRPLRRRPDTIARPARVRIRSRKPCTRARRRLFGWKVRLPLATAVSPHCIWPPINPRIVIRGWTRRPLVSSASRW
jgi:hypothetical protein